MSQIIFLHNKQEESYGGFENRIYESIERLQLKNIASKEMKYKEMKNGEKRLYYVVSYDAAGRQSSNKK